MPLGISVRRFSVLWLGGAVAIVLFVGGVTATTLENHGWLGYLRLKKGGQLTNGVVERTVRGNHCQADYRFRVTGAIYRGSGSACSAQVGDQVLVTYLVADPTQSCLGVASDGLANEVIPIVLAGVISPPFIILVNLARRRWREDEGAA